MHGVARGSGTTRTERILTRFADGSFLRLWTYPNLFRDQGGGKEVCDLIVAFDDHIILFSDKEIAFPFGATELAWQRWHRAAIDKSVDQLIGARRWLQTYPQRLYLDRACREHFPLALDPASLHFHLVCVAAGSSQRSKEEGGGAGSLMVGAAPAVQGRPFAVSATQRGEIVLVLDEVTLPIVFGQLDTAPDFVAYLCEREQFIRSGRLHASFGEEQLLALYLTRALTKTVPRFLEGSEKVALADDLWSGVSSEEMFRRYHEYVRASYAWDSIIEEFSGHVMNGSVLDWEGQTEGLLEHERRLRVLARTNRVERLELSRALEQLLSKPREPFQALFRCVRMDSRPDTIFAFVVAPDDDFTNHDEYRRVRAEMAREYCMAIKSCHPDVMDVVGIASAPTDSREQSEDVWHLNARYWTHELQRMAESIRLKTGYYLAPYITGRGRMQMQLVSAEHRRRLRNEAKRLRRERRKG